MNSRLAISSRNDYERELADTDKMQSKPNTFCNTFNIRELEAIVSSSYTRDDDKKLEAFLRVRKYIYYYLYGPDLTCTGRGERK